MNLAHSKYFYFMDSFSQILDNHLQLEYFTTLSKYYKKLLKTNTKNKIET